jgi:glucose/arabinose dehydrogenase
LGDETKGTTSLKYSGENKAARMVEATARGIREASCVVAGFPVVAGSRRREHVKRARRTMLAVIVASAAALLALGGAAPAQDAGAPEPLGASPFKVVAQGLDNPRGLAIGPNGTLYVAEAGKGGTGPCGVNAEGGKACYGKSGAVTRLKDGAQRRL